MRSFNNSVVVSLSELSDTTIFKLGKSCFLTEFKDRNISFIHTIIENL